MTIETTAGEVVVEAPYGQDRQTGQWLSPTRERFGLGPHQRLSPVLEEKLCFTATLTNSYEKAAAIAAKWGAAADDATIHRPPPDFGSNLMRQRPALSNINAEAMRPEKLIDAPQSRVPDWQKPAKMTCVDTLLRPHAQRPRLPLQSDPPHQVALSTDLLCLSPGLKLHNPGHCRSAALPLSFRRVSSPSDVATRRNLVRRNPYWPT